MKIDYDSWKLQSPPTNDTQELLKCECCYEEVDELFSILIDVKNKIKKEYYCLECSINHNENEN